MEINKVTATRALMIAVLVLLTSLTTISFADDDSANGVKLDQALTVKIWDSGTSGSGFNPPPVNVSRAPQAATINVSYNPATCDNQGNLSPWPAEAQTAFTFALNIWGSLIESDVPIEVHACWEDFNDARLLGYARATGSYRDFTGAPQAGTWYPNALANALAGTDLDPTSADIITALNADDINWYFGIDGNPGFSQHDFVTVVLHEVGHGIGFAGSAQVGTLPGQTQTIGRWGFGSGFPIIYDTFVVDGSGNSVLNESIYPNSSPQLAALFQSNNLFFAGPNVQAANGNASARLYAPSPWEGGSSFSHFDLATFSGTINSLMTPSLSNGVANHSPGPVGAALLEDLGWVSPGDDPVTETPTATATATETAIPTETQTAVPTETSTLVPTETQSATAEPTSESTPVSTATATAMATATANPSETTTPQPTGTGTPVPTNTPAHTSTPDLPTSQDSLIFLPYISR